MCLAAMPPMPRVRHWSCPDQLILISASPLSDGLGSAATGPPLSWELEDLVCRPSRWEERVLEMREGRGERRRQRIALVARLAALTAQPLKKRPRQKENEVENIEEITGGEYF